MPLLPFFTNLGLWISINICKSLILQRIKDFLDAPIDTLHFCMEAILNNQPLRISKMLIVTYPISASILSPFISPRFSMIVA